MKTYECQRKLFTLAVYVSKFLRGSLHIHSIPASAMCSVTLSSQLVVHVVVSSTIQPHMALEHRALSNTKTQACTENHINEQHSQNIITSQCSIDSQHPHHMGLCCPAHQAQFQPVPALKADIQNSRTRWDIQ
jgi:hypothetical protein